MSLPRDLSGTELASLLGRKYGYFFIRQRGSHIRLSSTEQGFTHHISVPRHNPLRVGTLSGILADVADYFSISTDEVRRELFG